LQNQLRRLQYGIKMTDPGLQVVETAFRRLLQPEMVARQVKSTGATGNAAALADRKKQFVVLQLLANRAVDGPQSVDEDIDFIQQAAEFPVVDIGILLPLFECRGQTLQFLDDFLFDIRAAEDVLDFQHIHQCCVTVPERFTGQIDPGLGVQVLQTQQSANSLVQRLLINYGAIHIGSVFERLHSL
jgi:hypothetical protein